MVKIYQDFTNRSPDAKIKCLTSLIGTCIMVSGRRLHDSQVGWSSPESTEDPARREQPKPESEIYSSCPDNLTINSLHT